MTTITSTEAGATGRYINLGSAASQDGFVAQTTIAYCKPASNAVSGYLFSKVTSTAVSGPRFLILADRTVSFGADCTGTTLRPERFTTPSAAALGTWAHYQTTWDGDVVGSAINIYIDGGANVAVNQNAGSGTINSDAAQDLYLMNRPGLGREFVGDIAYVARWNRVLSDAERTTVRTTGPLDVPTGLTLCWANGQDYGPYALTPVARSTFVAGSTPTNTALGGTADTTAPTLTTPTGTATGATTASGTVSTDEANGTLYWLASTNATELLATVKAGSSQAVTATGSQAVSVTGLIASTGYYLHYVHTDAAANDSTVSNSALFTTDAAVAVIKGVTLTLSNGAILQASLTGIRALWWDAIDPSGAPTYSTATASTNSSGVLTLNLDASTANAVGAYGFLLLYKVNATRNDSLAFAGQVAVSDIA